MTDYELIKAALREHGGTVLFEATHVITGIRSRYRKGEHLNVGEGWLMMNVDEPLPSCVPHIKLREFVVLEQQAQTAN